MKKKSGSRRRTKVVHRSKKNLRRTGKRKSLAKGRRRPTRRHSRIQRGGVLTDHALNLYKTEAAQGNADAQFHLGFMFDKGQGVAQDDAEAMRLYRLAAVQGHADAQNNLGNMFNYGYGVVQNYAEAVRLYRLAAEQGHAGAQYNLGLMFEFGQGVTKDEKEAIRLYQIAARQGHPMAISFLKLKNLQFTQG